MSRAASTSSSFRPGASSGRSAPDIVRQHEQPESAAAHAASRSCGIGVPVE